MNLTPFFELSLRIHLRAWQPSLPATAEFCFKRQTLRGIISAYVSLDVGGNIPMQQSAAALANS